MQSAVDARRQSDENPKSSVAAETMKLLVNGSCCYKIIDRSRHTVTKYLTNEKPQAANNSKLFKKLDQVNNSLYEVEFAKAHTELREPIICRLHHSSIRKSANVGVVLQLLHQRFCDINKFEELERETDWLYLALAEKELEDCKNLK